MHLYINSDYNECLYDLLQISLHARKSRSTISFGVQRSCLHEGKIRAYERMVFIQGKRADIVNRYAINLIAIILKISLRYKLNVL